MKHIKKNIEKAEFGLVKGVKVKFVPNKKVKNTTKPCKKCSK